MRSIKELIKGHDLHSISDDCTVLEATQLMVAQNIGAVPVTKDGALVGIFSERDLLKRVVSERRDPYKLRISEVMTRDPMVVSPDETIQNCMLIMKQNGFRHLPICDGKKLIGVVSVRDLLLHDLDEKSSDLELIRAYVQTST